jgi:Pyridoxamine 5'-phosphate oxidase
MPSWSAFEAEAPELAALARRYLDARVHKTLATLRRDGSPRISGTEVEFRDGDLWIGSMWMARKAQDLRRDPRFALHSGSEDPAGWSGDAKLSGRMVEEQAGTPEQPSHAFRADIEEVSVVHLTDDRKAILVEWWRPGQGVRSLRRD